MADNGTTARPYAQAVFEIARTDNQFAAWSDFLRLAAELVLSPDASRLLSTPGADTMALAGAMADICREQLDNPALLKDGTAQLAVSGVLAYSAVCTHKACTVNSWKAAEAHWRCYCHLSEFDAADGGKVTGGPAQTALPSVGLAVDAEGFLTAATLFSRKPGISA